MHKTFYFSYLMNISDYAQDVVTGLTSHTRCDGRSITVCQILLSSASCLSKKVTSILVCKTRANSRIYYSINT